KRRRGFLALTAVALTVVFIAGACGATPQPNPETPRRWKFTEEPTFADEFNVDGPVDPNLWFPLVQVRHSAALTDSTRNVRVEGGSLVIEAHAEELNGKRFTSAMIQSQNEFLHGRFESRMKFPLGAGTWPAFWLCCTGAWPDSGEIDIVEHYAGRGDVFDLRTGWAESNLHSTPNLLGSDRLRLHRTKIDPAAWHTYAVEWAPDEIRFYVDDVLTGINRASDPASADGGWPFATEPEVLLFDLFLGGPAGPVAASAMPQQFLVDWVRVYDLVGEA
ncbi:MAG TPA: glycoside hydrolase family 16 protein, partial [Microthrixaceae bacterium]|nr:glycoside hydrolase family 16 protein [Microthrixaceae bacterium]